MPKFDPLTGIQRFYDAENEFCRAEPGKRDIRLMLNELDPDVVVEVPDSLPHGGAWRGHAGFRELFDAVTEHWAVFEVAYNKATWRQIDEERVFTEGALRAALRAGGKPVTMPVVSLFTFTDRGLSRLVHFYKDTAAIVSASR